MIAAMNYLDAFERRLRRRPRLLVGHAIGCTTVASVSRTRIGLRPFGSMIVCVSLTFRRVAVLALRANAKQAPTSRSVKGILAIGFNAAPCGVAR